MESATVLTLCSAFGLRGGSVAGVVVNRAKKEKITKDALLIGETNVVKTTIKAMEILVTEDKIRKVFNQKYYYE